MAVGFIAIFFALAVIALVALDQVHPSLDHHQQIRGTSRHPVPWQRASIQARPNGYVSIIYNNHVCT